MIITKITNKRMGLLRQSARDTTEEVRMLTCTQKWSLVEVNLSAVIPMLEN